VTGTVYYLGTVEKWLKPNGRYEWRRDLAGVAQYTHIMNSSHAQTSLVKRYAYKDALGSLVMMTDDLGNLLPGGLDMNYTPWGERALANDWSYAQTGNFLGTTWALLFPSNKGFTGHEMLDNVGLIHMNGRIYDQRLQRFVQADPYIQNPGYSQSYNRYSYVMNNPLNRTDPSGYQCEGNGCIGNAWGSGGNYIIQIDNGSGGYTLGGWSHCTGCLSTYTPGYSSLGQADLHPVTSQECLFIPACLMEIPLKMNGAHSLLRTVAGCIGYRLHLRVIAVRLTGRIMLKIWAIG